MPAPLDLPISLPEQRRLTVVEFQRMVEAGVIDEDEPVELLEGVLVPVPPIGEEHSATVWELTHLVVKALPDGFRALPSCPVNMGPYSQPQPNLAIIPAPDRSKPPKHPEFALLVIEVSSTSLRYDRTVKAPIYARAGIPEYWIVDVNARTVEVRKDPDPANATYRSLTTFGETDVLAAEFVPLPPMPVASFLP